MVIDSGVILPQTCNVFRKETSTDSLGAKIRGYPDAATTTGIACLLGRSRPETREGIQRELFGNVVTEFLILIYAATTSIQEEDQIVMQTNRAGVALSSTQKERHTYHVQQVLDGTLFVGHEQAVVTAIKKRAS